MFALFVLKRSAVCWRYYAHLRLHGSRAFVCRILRTLRRIERIDPSFIDKTKSNRDLILGHHPKHVIFNARGGLNVLNNAVFRWADDELLAFVVLVLLRETQFQSSRWRLKKGALEAAQQTTREWLWSHGLASHLIDGFFVR